MMIIEMTETLIGNGDMCALGVELDRVRMMFLELRLPLLPTSFPEITTARTRKASGRNGKPIGVVMTRD